MNFCPYCDYEGVVSNGVTATGWAFCCEACGAEWTDDDGWTQ